MRVDDLIPVMMLVGVSYGLLCAAEALVRIVRRWWRR